MIISKICFHMILGQSTPFTTDLKQITIINSLDDIGSALGYVSYQDLILLF